MTKYITIVIDPPWDIKPFSQSDKSIYAGKLRDIPYSTMTDKEIMEYPIDDYAGTNCDLFMWTTQAKLPVTLEIIKAWGFKYHKLLTWDKSHGFTVHGFVNSTEFLVYAYRGRRSIDFSKPIKTCFKFRRGKHSEKPAAIYEILKKFTSDPRIDIFGRKSHIGFEGIGNEYTKRDTLEAFV